MRKQTGASMKAQAASQRPELVSNVRARETRQRKGTSYATEQRQPHGGIQSPRGARGIQIALPDNTATDKVLVIAASSLIAWTALPFYIPQLMFWLLGLLGIGMKTVPLAGAILPGEALFFFTYLMIAIIGFCSMLYAAFVYMLRGVRCFEGARTLVFMCCLTGYLIPFLNLVPWVVFWLLAVIFAKNEEGS
jgi:hypothetical protein